MQSPIFASHLQSLHCSTDCSQNIQYQAERSNMAWVRSEIATLFSQLHHVTVLRRTECSGEAVSPEGRLSNIAAFWTLTVSIAAERAWYMLGFTHTLPEALCGLLDEDQGRSRDCMDRFVLM